MPSTVKGKGLPGETKKQERGPQKPNKKMGGLKKG